MKITAAACALAALWFFNVAVCGAQDNLPEWVSRIREEHPRLFFNADTLPAARHRALTAEREFYEQLKHHADNTEPGPGRWLQVAEDPPELTPRPGSEVAVRDWGFQALSSAVVYMVEPSAERLRRIRDMLWASLDYYHASYADNHSPNYYSWTRISWLAAMDLVWNDLEPAERSEMGLSIMRHADEVLNKPGIRHRSTGGHISGYYGGRNMALFTGLLFHNAGIEDEAALELLLDGWSVYARLMPHANEPVFEGRTWRSDQDRGRIFAKTLLPEDAVIEPVGGPGREFPVKGVNYLYDAMLVDGEVPELMGRWRVEVKPGAAREEDVFLHVIEVGGRSAEKMEPARLKAVSDAEAEAVFEARGREVTLRLNTAGDIGGRIRITEGGEVLLDRALTEEVQPQEGLGIF